MKCPVYLSVLVTFSLLSCDVLASSGGPAPAIPIGHSDAVAVSSSEDGTISPSSQFVIPGPQRSFLRMAGISQHITADEVLPLLSRNVFTQGYEIGRPTEFLILLRRYVVQARELTALAANSAMVLRVSNCDEARPLLHILGYRTREDCRVPGTTLQTEDPERAFLAIDSGFPMVELEQALQGGKPFEYPYSSSPVPVLFSEGDWVQASPKNYKENSRDLLDTLLNDPTVARLYWGLSRLDSETSNVLRQAIGLAKLLRFAPALDFYGRGLRITAGVVNVPGGVSAEKPWSDLVGASPRSPADFVLQLLAKNKGWLVAYYDALSRVSGVRQAYFTDPDRLPFFYEGLSTPDHSASATSGAFRPAPALLLLVSRLHLESNGEALVPGNLEVWKEILLEKHNANKMRKLGKPTSHLTGSDRVVQAMFAWSRSYNENGPLQQYMAISEIDGRRLPGQRLSPATVRLLARKFEEFSDQYRIFSEFPELSDESITLFLNVAQGLSSVPAAEHGNAFGIFQANVGIWQILARQGQISNSNLDDSWQQVIKPFAAIRSAAQVCEAGKMSLGELFRFSTGKARGSQDEMIDLLAGPRQSTPEGKQMHREVAGRIRAVLDDQRLVSLDTLLAVGDALAEKARGNQPPQYVIVLASQTREFEMPRPIFTNGERTEWAAGLYNNHHTDLQMQIDLPKILQSPAPSHAQIAEARAQLASFLRDTLVGLNYAYYEPPGAQALHNNPLFVRSHDFAGDTVSGIKTPWQAPQLLGEGSPAGGGAHLVGSLADLPFALADLEQDFISPNNVQALIWKEFTPGLLSSAILPRWWDVSPLELHAIALYQRAGEELLTGAAQDQALRSEVLAILSDRLPPKRSAQIERALRSGHASDILPQMMPADTFYLAVEFRHKYPEQAGAWGAASEELQALCRQHPEQVSWKRLSHDFGTPHPAVAQNYGLELLNMTPMPPFSGTPSRFLAESWDSPNLYWARLADEAGYAPVMLNHLVPELTRILIEKTFATDFEDWPALLRAMHETGAEFREGKLTLPSRASAVRP